VSASRSLRRLLELRRAEEEHRKAQLQLAIGELSRLELSLRSARAQTQRGRALLAESIRTGDTEGRLTGMHEVEGSERRVHLLSARVRSLEAAVEKLRGDLLAKRLERRQAGSLVESAMAREDLERRRRSQLALDDWFQTQNSSKNGASSAKSEEMGCVDGG
jgi:flagellar export protein FliJ